MESEKRAFWGFGFFVCARTVSIQHFDAQELHVMVRVGLVGCATSDPPYRSAGATDPMHESPSFFLPPNKNAPLSQERSQERSVHLICPEPVLTLTNILGLNAKMAFKAGSFCLAHLRMDHGINRHAIKLKAAHVTVTVPFPD